MIVCVCSECGITANFDEFEYRQAEEEGDTPFVCDCCGEGELIPIEKENEDENL